MYELYKKVEKSIENPNGAKKIEENENPFEEGPCLLCISAQNLAPKSIFGLTKIGTSMARVRTKDDIGGRISLADVPISFLSIKHADSSKDDKKETDRIKEFVEKYIKPLLIDKNGKKFSTEVALKNVRNINMLSNCDGTKKALAILNEVEKILSDYGFKTDEAKIILSQITLLSFQTGVDLSKCHASVIDFHNLNDREVEINYSNIDGKMIEKTNQSKLKESVELANDNRIEVLRNGENTHEVRDYLNAGQATPVIVYTIMTSILENSVLNSNSSEKFIPISVTDLFEKSKLILSNAEQGISKEEQVTTLDETISYGGVTKLTDREITLISENERNVEEYNRQNESLGRLKSEKDNQYYHINKMIEVAKENCTESTFLRILDASGYQLSEDEKSRMSEPSDKDLVEGKDVLIKKLQSMVKKLLEFADIVSKSRVGKFFFRKSIKQLPAGNDYQKE